MVVIFERFTERARQVVVLAQDEARSNHHAHVGMAHLAVGLIREEHGLAAQVLTQVGIKREDISYVGLPELNHTFEEQVTFSAGAKKVCELALREALALGHNYIGTEHLLLGYLRACEDRKGDPLGDQADKIREALHRALSGPKRAKAQPKPPPVVNQHEDRERLEDACVDMVREGFILYGKIKNLVKLVDHVVQQA